MKDETLFFFSLFFKRRELYLFLGRKTEFFFFLGRLELIKVEFGIWGRRILVIAGLINNIDVFFGN